ncbi:MAG: maleylpyruvate isomerase family mycothiol-dependent enzyme, partial [Actinomycetota bacterium]|nr:maleylpyruvate isomerase family mycothiol-dependent enzyme [Actinomycetota bacterium]
EHPTAVSVRIVCDGLDPEVVWVDEAVAVEPQAMADDAPEQGCGWTPTLRVAVDDTWRSGMYVVQLGPAGGEAAGAGAGAESAAAALPSAWFVVRAATPTPGAPLLKLATNTWNAYNDVGGRNLYTGALMASPQRPLGAGFLSKPSGEGSRVVDDTGDFLNFAIDHELSLWHGMSGWAGQERRFVEWAEAAGIELDYAIDADLDRPDGAALLVGRRLLLSVGHDEYWTWGMRDRVEDFVAAGGSVAFLSGNTAYWQVRLEHDDRVMAAYKHHYREDPVTGTDRQHLVTSMWADPLTGRPEAAMTGVSFTRGGYHRVHLSAPRGSAGYEVQRHEHWLLEGTDLCRGDLFGTEDRVVGYECDGTDLTVVDGLLTATGSGGTPDGFTVVATAPATAFDRVTTPLPVEEGNEYELEFHAKRLLGADTPEHMERLRHGFAVLGEWTHASGGTVVTVGCTDWAYGLGDLTVARITRNVLRRLGGVRGRAASPLIDLLDAGWASLDELLAGLEPSEWTAPTGCPGWSVQDNVSHLIDYEAVQLGRPRPLHDFDMPDHARNELGQANELGVDARRSMSGAEVLEEFRRTVAARSEQLRGLVASDLDREVLTPAGPGTARDMLRLRVMDTWSHEQDIRRALRRPGHVDGPVVAESIDYFAQFLPFVVGKRAGAPDGASVVFAIGDVARLVVEVVDGRARLGTDEPAAPTAVLTVPVTTFAALVGGRSDVPDDVGVDGDESLARAVVAGMGFMP